MTRGDSGVSVCLDLAWCVSVAARGSRLRSVVADSSPGFRVSNGSDCIILQTERYKYQFAGSMGYATP